MEIEDQEIEEEVSAVVEEAEVEQEGEEVDLEEEEDLKYSSFHIE